MIDFNSVLSAAQQLPAADQFRLIAALSEAIPPNVSACPDVKQRSGPVSQPIVPRDEWERRLLSAASDCGVSLPNSALSSDGLYD
jgi:hypothetical protein